ncbi:MULTISPECIES: hypothetical protein [unclassified Empedobacter]|uniref:hypothetical protein n=1 Tax=unclassified Empedobacter TaxID=2643773 RepID=UPI0025C64344|nr:MULTISPECIES: hypothetical protein [unclassified Empedobacter]
MKSGSLILLFLTIFLLFSCASQNLSYKEKQISKFSQLGYKILLENKPINIKYYFLTKKNVKKVVKNNQNKTITIELSSDTKLLKGKEFLQEIQQNFRNNRDYELIVINGIPYEKNQIDSINFDLKSLDQVTILKQESANKISHRIFNSDILVLKTK